MGHTRTYRAFHYYSQISKQTNKANRSDHLPPSCLPAQSTSRTSVLLPVRKRSRISFPFVVRSALSKSPSPESRKMPPQLSKRRLPRRLPSSSTTPNSVPHKFKFPAPLDLTMMMEATSHKTPSETAMRSHKKRNPVPVSLLSTLPTATYSVTRPSRRPSISTPSTEFPTASCPPSPTSIRSTMPPTRPPELQLARSSSTSTPRAASRSRTSTQRLAVLPMLRRFPIPRRQLASVVVTRRCAAAHLESVHAAIVQRPRPSPLLAPTRRPANAEEMTRTVHVKPANVLAAVAPSKRAKTNSTDFPDARVSLGRISKNLYFYHFR